MNRRKFIQYTGAVGTAISLAPIIRTGAATIQTHLKAELPWYRKPLRILQTVLCEPDASNYDAKSVVANMEKIGCNTLIVNGGGIVDFFQNPLPTANIIFFSHGY